MTDSRNTGERGGMRSFIETLFFAGIGGAAIARDKVRARLDDLVEEGRINAEEARGIMDDLSEGGQREWNDVKSGVRDMVRQMLAEMGVPDAERMDALERRIEALERAGSDSDTGGA